MASRWKRDHPYSRARFEARSPSDAARATFPDGQPRHVSLAPIADFSAATLKSLVAATPAPSARVVTDGWSGYAGCPSMPKPRRSSARWPPISSCAGTTACSRTLSDGRSGSSTACGDSISGATLTPSPFAGTAVATPPQPSTPCSAALPASNRPPRATSSTRASEAGRDGDGNRLHPRISRRAKDASEHQKPPLSPRVHPPGRTTPRPARARRNHHISAKPEPSGEAPL